MILSIAIFAVNGCVILAAGHYMMKARRLRLAVKDLEDQLARTEAKLAETRKRLDVSERDLARAIGGLRWFGIRGNWTNDGGRDGRFAWTGGRDWPWLRARKAMGRFWTPEPGGEVKDEG